MAGWRYPAEVRLYLTRNLYALMCPLQERT